MRKSLFAVCVFAGACLMIQSPLRARGGGAAHAGGGVFSGGGFNGGSIGSAGHVVNPPYYGGGYYGYPYQIGPTEIAGDGDMGGTSGSSAPVGYGGTGGGPPEQLQDGTGVYKSGGSGEADGPSWDSDWWANDPQAAARQKANAVVGATVASLPLGYETAYLSSQPYYYNKGTFYTATDSGYEVVVAPIGITVRNPPDGAELVTVNGQQYFQTGDTYYQALYSGNGLVYQVVEDPHASS
jgi:hypothetical protein